MTKTQYLQLNRWVDSDPVDLAQMNENFSILDQKGGHTISCSDAASINASCLLLQAKREGKDVSYAQRAALFDLTCWDDIAQYEHVLVSPSGTKISQASYSGGTSYVKLNISQSKSPLKAYTFTPSSYATLTSIYLDFNGSSYDGRCWCELRCGSEVVAQSETVTLSSAKNVTFPVSAALDPNKTYEIYVSVSSNILAVLGNLTLTAQPLAPSSGKLTSVSAAVPTNTKRIVLHLHKAGTAPAVQLQFDGGAFGAALAAASSSSDTFCRYDAAVPEGAQSVVARVTLNAADTLVYGLCGAML